MKLSDEYLEQLRQDSIHERIIVGSDVRALIAMVKSLQAERDKYREALQGILAEYDNIDDDDALLGVIMRIAQSALKEE